MASDSAEDEAFVRDFFPALYREAFLNPRHAVRARDQASGVREPQRLARAKRPQQFSAFDDQASSPLTAASRQQ
jgi:hypothetical protein